MATKTGCQVKWWTGKRWVFLGECPKTGGAVKSTDELRCKICAYENVCAVWQALRHERLARMRQTASLA